jgi:quercetin dioxygenase-like cupin family protein
MSVDKHKFKLPLDEVPVDGSLTEDTGWSGMAVQWIVTSDSVGATDHVVGLTVFAPGARHHHHRHPNAEEAQYLIKGSGIARVGDADIEQDTGDTVFVPKNEWHGFWNNTEEDTVMIWTYGGAANLAEAGYVRHDEDEGSQSGGSREA